LNFITRISRPMHLRKKGIEVKLVEIQTPASYFTA
jgi:hypothetical protein